MTDRQKFKPVYWAWKSMKQRCLNPKCSAFQNYGGRGIGICEEWLLFEPFLTWALENGWECGLDLDRIDNDKGYSPDNCRWATRRQNINNRRKTILISANGETLPRTEWEKRLNLPLGTIKAWVETHDSNYAKNRIEEILRNGYTPCDFTRNHAMTKVTCLENGETYISLKSAGKALGVNSGNILRAIRTKGTTGGYHFTLS